MIASLPKKPALGRGHIWTRAKINKVTGRWCKIGWSDSDVSTLLVLEGDWSDVRAYDPETQDTRFLDSPAQIIDIGPKLFVPKLI